MHHEEIQGILHQWGGAWLCGFGGSWVWNLGAASPASNTKSMAWLAPVINQKYPWFGWCTYTGIIWILMIIRLHGLWYIMVIYIHIKTYTHAYIHMYTCTYVYVCMYVYIYNYIYIHLLTTTVGFTSPRSPCPGAPGACEWSPGPGRPSFPNMGPVAIQHVNMYK